MTTVFISRGHRHAQRKDHVNTQLEKAAIYNPRRAVSEKPNPANTLISDS